MERVLTAVRNQLLVKPEKIVFIDITKNETLEYLIEVYYYRDNKKCPIYTEYEKETDYDKIWNTFHDMLLTLNNEFEDIYFRAMHGILTTENKLHRAMVFIGSKIDQFQDPKFKITESKLKIDMLCSGLKTRSSIAFNLLDVPVLLKNPS